MDKKTVKVNSVLLYGRDDNQEVVATKKEIIEVLGARGINVYDKDVPKDAKIDLIISLGGDGTVLAAARLLKPADCPIMPISLGTFGFITEISKTEWLQCFEAFERGEARISRRMRIMVRVLRDGKEIFNQHLMNDAIFRSSLSVKVIKLGLHINDTFLGSIKGDGLLVATPTGSTAYNLSNGGPILGAEMDALVLNPVAPFSLYHRPFVLSGEDEVHIFVESDQRNDVMMSIDGQDQFRLEEQDEIIIMRAPAYAQLIQAPHRTYYDVVRTKFRWGGCDEACDKNN